MSNIPEGRSPLGWADLRHPSTWDAEVKALRAESERLRAIALDYRHILHSAKAGRDLYCGSYVAKEYRFTRDQIDAALLKIEQALKGSKDE